MEFLKRIFGGGGKGSGGMVTPESLRRECINELNEIIAVRVGKKEGQTVGHKENVQLLKHVSSVSRKLGQLQPFLVFKGKDQAVFSESLLQLMGSTHDSRVMRAHDSCERLKLLLTRTSLSV